MTFSVLDGCKVQFLCIFHLRGILIELKIGSQLHFHFIPPTSRLRLAGPLKVYKQYLLRNKQVWTCEDQVS